MSVWNFIYNKYINKIDVILLYVLSSTGSSPGRQGFKMGVAADDSFEGSIGGGIMEYKFVEMAKSLLSSDTVQNKEIYKQVHSKEEPNNQSGMICSGEQTIFLHRINDDDIKSIEHIIQAEANNAGGTLVLTSRGIDFDPQPAGENFYFTQTEIDFLLQEKIGFKNILHIIGGGHCALALSRLMSQMDFYIYLYDDRVNLDTINKNGFVHEVHLLNSFSEVSSFVHEDRNVFVVIMTFGYRTDDLALRALLHKNFTYLGVMGSRKKMEQMFKAYLDDGISESRLARIHAPIGIQIKSKTPAEIAVSIAAEIIKVKNETA